MKHLRGLWPFVRPDTWRFVVALLLTPAIATIVLMQPLILKDALDGHVVAGRLDGLAEVALRYLATVVGAFVLEGAYTLLLAAGAENTIWRLRRALFSHTLTLSQRFLDRQPAGQLMSRATSDVDALNEALSAGSVSILLDVLVMVGTLGVMLSLDVRLTFLLLLVGAPLGAIIEFFRRRMRELYADLRDALAALNAFLSERIAGVETIQLQRLEARAQGRFGELNARFRDANVLNNYYDATLFALIDGVASVCVAIMLGYGAWRLGLAEADRAGITVGLVVAFVEYVDRVFRPLRELSGKLNFLQRASTALDKIFWLLGVDDRITPGDTEAPEAKGRLRLRDVRFRYRADGPWVLDGVNLDVAPGQRVAVVGRTGSGKSTLVRLLARIHDGYEGSIELDGVELRRIAPQAVRRVIGSVRQEVQLFADTLRFNVTLGDATLDPARVEAAIAASNLDRVAARREKGLDANLRERGGDLSAGEAQIVALARTLARDPAVVVLDEATANIDPVSEALLQQALDRVFASRTCLVVAHRLSTIVDADRIVVLDAGRVVETGTHAELLASGGAYASLYAEGFVQAEAFADDLARVEATRA